jgi:hypothetical protein
MNIPPIGLEMDSEVELLAHDLDSPAPSAVDNALAGDGSSGQGAKKSKTQREETHFFQLNLLLYNDLVGEHPG